VSGVSIEFDGDGRPEWNVQKVSIVEDSTPLDPDDMTGGVGQIDVTIPETPTRVAADVRKRPVVVEHHGVTSAGVVLSASDDGSTVSISANGPRFGLNVIRVIPPYNGTLGGLFDMLLGLCGVSGDTEAAIASTVVTVPGGRMNVFDRLKEVCHAWQAEVAEVDGVVTLRQPRQEELLLDSISHGQITRGIDDGDLARAVEVSYYSPAYITNGLVYPQGGWTDKVSVFSMEAGETVEVEVELDASLSSVKRPTCVASVARTYVGPNSVYCVAGNDGLIISPKQWADGGGEIDVKIGEDTRSIIITITASANLQYAPYRIMMPSGETEGYSSLRIVGTGVTFEQKTITMPASVDSDVQREVGATIDNECIATWNQAFNVALRTAGRFAGPKKTITFVVDAAAGAKAGMRVRYRDSYYRIRSVVKELGITRVTAEADTTIADHNAAWAGKTITDWNTHWAGKTMRDVKGTPLSVP